MHTQTCTNNLTIVSYPGPGKPLLRLMPEHGPLLLSVSGGLVALVANETQYQQQYRAWRASVVPLLTAAPVLATASLKGEPSNLDEVVTPICSGKV